MKKPMACFLLIALFGCGPPVDPTTAPFDPSEAAFVLNGGSSSIEGQGFLRQMGGTVVTCAGEDVLLIPASKFAVERFTYIYGDPNGGQSSYSQITEAPADYLRYTRKTVCDAQGNFKFSGIPSGDYYVQTSVVWSAGGYGLTEGGALSKRVAVSSGQRASVILN